MEFLILECKLLLICSEYSVLGVSKTKKRAIYIYSLSLFSKWLQTILGMEKQIGIKTISFDQKSSSKDQKCS
jgi:hypothetical protein